LQGVSGAGKTTLLDALASRITMGVVTGQVLVDGLPRDKSFQRKTGYATQQDLHLHTATVREALSFSALLRQPDRYSRQEKLDYVNEVIKLVDLTDCADAVVGISGEGLNVEQRKRLTIGVELAARPQLLLFLDEPTSGLDSQTSWAICDLMEKLTKNGQAILCTIHQPSAALFQRFDRLLLLAKGGRTVYFGPIGRNSHVLIDYFQRHGADAFDRGDGAQRNPAEYMLEVIGAAPNSKQTDVDWPMVWRASSECQEVQEELRRLSSASHHTTDKAAPEHIESENAEFATGLGSQMLVVTNRVFQQYWRTPGYILSKAVLTAGSVGRRVRLLTVLRVLTSFIGFVYRTVSGQRRDDFPRTIQPDASGIYLPSHLWANRRAGDAHVRLPAHPVRSPRETSQGILVGSFPLWHHHCGTLLEFGMG
jgi:ABC-type multidrug transport system ATPase subunit